MIIYLYSMIICLPGWKRPQARLNILPVIAREFTAQYHTVTLQAVHSGSIKNYMVMCNIEKDWGRGIAYLCSYAMQRTNGFVL